MSEPFDLIALGETMLSLIAVDGSLDLATSFRATHGGAESNACVAIARLGGRPRGWGVGATLPANGSWRRSRRRGWTSDGRRRTRIDRRG